MAYNISISDTLSDGSIERPFYFNHKTHALTVKISDSSYKNIYHSRARWDFGDGTVIEGVEATHYYKRPGRYEISCTLYKGKREPHPEAVNKKTIYVREIIPTELSFYNKEQWEEKAKNGCYLSKNNKLGELCITMGTDFISDLSVRAYRIWDTDKSENSYFDISNESFYHLKKYYSFLKEDFSLSVDEKIKNSILRPTEIYSPSYKPIYGKIIWNDKLQYNLYYIKERTSDNDIKLNLYESLDGNRVEVNVIGVKKYSNIPDDCKNILGKFALLNIWYKNDYQSSKPNKLSFEIDKKSIKYLNEESLSESYLNIPALGISVTLNETDELIPALTLNGLYSVNKNNEPVSDSTIKVENHLIHNFYKDYQVEAFMANYIKNDCISADDSISYNIYKNAHCPDIFETNNDSVHIDKIVDNDYYKKYSITPYKEGFEILSGDGKTIIYKNKNIIDFKELVLPTEKQYKQNVDDVLNTYLQHPMFENASNLKIFLKDIFDNKNLLSYLSSKGINFIDDHINHKTCYIKELLSYMTMLDEPIKQYDINSFENINELKELTRILSMNYSQLFGNLIEDDYDINISATTKGKNVADIIYTSDSILCDKNYNIIALRRGSKILKLAETVPYIIIKDDFTNKTHLVNLHNIPTFEIEDFSDQSEEWINDNEQLISNVCYAYKLSDYTYKWGWGLNLPPETDNISNKESFINGYYTFFLFKKNDEVIRKFNFLDEETIPKKNGKQLSVKEWEEEFGFTYDCLMKVLSDTLSLK